MASIVVIPTYNERLNVENLVSQLRTVSEVPVLFVDDDSPDGTAECVREMGKTQSNVHLLHRKEGRGFAQSYKAGIQWALEKGYQKIVQMDSDLSHPPQLVPKLLDALEGSDVAMGCRYMPGGGVENWGLSRRIMSRMGNLYAQAVLSMPITDLTGGFVAWRAKSLEKIYYQSTGSKGYAFLIELKYRAKLSGLTFAEVPFVFPDRTQGESKMSASIFGEAFLNVLRLRASRRKLLRGESSSS